MAGNNVVSPYTMRRRPIRGPMMNSIWGALLFVLGAGLGVTALMLFTTASPLNELKDQAGRVWWIMALMISPYPGLFILALDILRLQGHPVPYYSGRNRPGHRLWPFPGGQLLVFRPPARQSPEP